MPKAHSKDLADQAIRLYVNGDSSVSVATQLGVSKFWVLVQVRKAGVVRPLLEAFRISKRTWPSGSDCHTWRGGRRKHSDGYVEVLMPDHPMAQDTGYVLEHRLVMSIKLKRMLLPGEDVHHKNGVRSDNDPDNLELLDHPAHMSHHAARRQRHAEGHFGTKERKHHGD